MCIRDRDYTLSKGPLAPYAIEIARGVSANRDRIDSALRAVSANWTLERMPGADRNLLRAAVYELYFQVADTLDAAVVINEAVEICLLYTSAPRASSAWTTSPSPASRFRSPSRRA